MNARSTRSWPRIEASRDGFVLPTVILALAFMGLVGTTALRMSGDARRSAQAMHAGATAFYAAQMGLNWHLENWPAATVHALERGDSAVLAEETLPGGASFEATIHRFDNGIFPVWALTVTGRGGGSRGGRRVIRIWKEQQYHPSGLSSRNGVAIGGEGTTDSYDSRLGPYGGANIGSEGDVQTNGDLDLSASSYVSGDAIVGGSVLDYPDHVSGTTETGAEPIIYPDVDCPADPYTSPSALPPLTNPTSYDPSTGNLRIGAGHTVILESGTYYFHDIDVSSGSIDLAPGSEVQIFVSGAVTVNGGDTFNNTTQNPADMQFWGCGADTSPWSISGGNNAYFTVYAPNHDITINGGNAIWGAVTGASIDNIGGVDIHYDVALRSNEEQDAVPRSWIQLSL